MSQPRGASRQGFELKEAMTAREREREEIERDNVGVGVRMGVCVCKILEVGE